MRKGVFRDLSILLLLAAFLLGGGYFLARKLWSSGLDLSYQVSYHQEEQLGNLLSELVLKQYSVVEGTAADTALQQIKDRLTHVLARSPYHYRFVILRSGEINAFTLPGGNIYVFSGLIKFADSPEELAAVLAHEIGHAEKRHVVSKMEKQLSLSVLLSTLSGGDPGTVTQILTQMLGSSFDREQETQADQYGLGLLEKAKISPRNLARFFERLNDKDLDYNESLELLMSHPHNNKRIEQVRRYKTASDFHPVPLNISWERVKKSLSITDAEN